MIGAVLCGGQSTRMGSDKGLLKLQASTWAQTAVDKINPLEIPVFISINKAQLESYSTIFSTDQLIIDTDLLKMKGPLYGVLSVHLKFPHENLLVLGCDLPLMETELLKELLSHYRIQNSYDAFIFSTNGEPEPLCGIYKANGLSQIINLYQSGQLPKYSMKYMLEHIATHVTPAAAEKMNCFRNFNAHAELNGL